MDNEHYKNLIKLAESLESRERDKLFNRIKKVMPFLIVAFFIIALYEQGFINSIMKEQLQPSITEKTNPPSVTPTVQTTTVQKDITPWYQNLLIFVSSNINELIVGTLTTFIGGLMLHIFIKKL